MKEQVLTFLQRSWVKPAGIGVVSFGGGLAAGYLLARRRLKKTEEIVEEMIVQLELDFDQRVDDPNTLPEPTQKRVEEKILRYEELDDPSKAYVSKVFNVEEQEAEEPLEINHKPEVVNIFARTSTEWNYEEELATRSPDHPYIIHKDEFFSDEMGWDTQMSLTWYEGDQILCDERDVPIYNPEKTVGFLNFGHGSDDPNVVYIRNEELKAEYEIVRDPGSYEIEVLGGHVERDLQEVDLKHSRQPGKFREV